MFLVSYLCKIPPVDIQMEVVYVSQYYIPKYDIYIYFKVLK